MARRMIPLLITLAACVGEASDGATPPLDQIAASAFALDASVGSSPLDAGGDAGVRVEPVRYLEVPIASGLLRAGIVKHDVAHGRCVRLVLVDGLARGELDVRSEPPRMTVERAWISQNLAACDDPGFVPPEGAVLPTAVTGTLRAHAAGRCLLDVDVMLTFATGEPWVPARELLRVRGLDSSFACLVRR